VKFRIAGALAAALSLSVIAACGSNSDDSGSGSGSGGSSSPQTLTVWYMDGSMSDDTAADVKQKFQAAHDGVTVKYQVQTWDGIGDKLTTALGGNDSPDVVEIGNTQVPQYASVGALADVSDKVSDFDNSDTWLEGLAAPGQWEGKTYAVPFYAGDRTVIYRTDMFKKAGIKPPTSWADFVATGPKLRKAFGSDKKFMPLYLPGQEWYTLASLVWDEGGDLATKDGDAWKGSLDTPQGLAGIARYKEMFDKLSSAPADVDEATPQQYEVMSQGHVAMMIGLGWEKGSVEAADKKLVGKLGVFALPSKTAGQPAPPFVGGSDLAVSAASDQKDLATEFVQLVASTPIQTELAKAGAIPNSSALVSAASGNDTLGVQIEAAKVGKVTPVAPTWASVETNPNPIKDMLTKVLTGTPAATAAKAADDQITQRMAG
jgi:N,N'-diacetylchitobiose transport system substrate-binding protein